MAGSNTEQPANKAEQKKIVQKAPVKKNPENKAPVKVETKPEVKEAETKPEAKKTEKKKEVSKAPKKDSVSINARSLRISTKVAVAISKFIKGKTIDKAIEDLEAVTKLKKAVPMKGEIPHRKGRMMSGRFPQRAASEVLILVKSLKSNATQHDIEVPVIIQAVPNKAQRPYAKGGRARRKATHLTIVATEKKSIKQNKKKK